MSRKISPVLLKYNYLKVCNFAKKTYYPMINKSILKIIIFNICLFILESNLKTYREDINREKFKCNSKNILFLQK